MIREIPRAEYVRLMDEDIPHHPDIVWVALNRVEQIYLTRSGDRVYGVSCFLDSAFYRFWTGLDYPLHTEDPLASELFAELLMELLL